MKDTNILTRLIYMNLFLTFKNKKLKIYILKYKRGLVNHNKRFKYFSP